MCMFLKLAIKSYHIVGLGQIKRKKKKNVRLLIAMSIRNNHASKVGTWNPGFYFICFMFLIFPSLNKSSTCMGKEAFNNFSTHKSV